MATRYSIQLDHHQADALLLRLKNIQSSLSDNHQQLVGVMDELGNNWGGYARDESMKIFGEWSKTETNQVTNLEKLIEQIDEYVKKMVSYDSEAMKG